ncbi:MAG TPA: hypothetical protein VHD33_06315, partial [Legionellaceae bacterium]|nr:hypothetical protein [Legionellaceae bacterium]
MKFIYLGILIGLGCLQGCMSVASKEINRYQLLSVGRVAPVQSKHHYSILVMQPSAMVGYDTEQMLYMNKPYQIGV